MMNHAEADRTCAIALIRAFRKKYLMATFGLNEEQAARAQLSGIKPAEILRYYFGGSTRHWGNLLYNHELPTRLDLQCLRASIDIGDLNEIRQKSIRIRSMQKAAIRGDIKALAGAKAPIARRDGSVYDSDNWRAADELLDSVFGKWKVNRLKQPA
jgi:hypothetical protein